MAAHNYRYKRTGPIDLPMLQKMVGGAAIAFGSSTSTYLDVTADSTQLNDLDTAWAQLGFTRDSTDPVTTPNQQSSTALGTVFDPRKILWRDHFVTAILSGTALQSERNWAVSTVGTGPNVLAVAGETGRPGIIRLEAGTSAAARAVIYSGGAGAADMVKLNASQNTVYAGFKLRPQNSIAPTDLERLVFGFGSEWTTDAELANGIYVRYAPQLVGGDTSWILCTANGGTRTTSASGTVPVAGTEALFEIQITYPGGVPTARLYIDGVAVGSNITTNLPANAVSPGIGIYALTGVVAEAMVDCDYTYGYQDPT